MTVELSETTILVLVSTSILGLIGILYIAFGLKGRGDDSNADVSTGLKNEERNSASQGGDEKILNAALFKPFRVLKITKVSHNTKLIRFEVPYGKPLGLPIGRHISVRAVIDGKPVMRAYTPTSRPDTTGYFDLLVKCYEYGKMSTHLHSLKVGNTLEVRGPIGRFKYEKNMYKIMGFIAGGTGLTPCLQVIRCVLEGSDAAGDHTKLVLLFQNRKEEDVLLREELDKLAQQYKGRLTIIFFLSNASTSAWGTGAKADVEQRGYINEAAMKKYIDPKDCQLVGVCGPSGFNEAMQQLLGAAGHANEAVYVW